MVRLTSRDYSVPKGSLGIVMGVCEHIEPEAYEVQWIERGGLSAPVLPGDLEHVSEILLPKPAPPEPTDVDVAMRQLSHDDWAIVYLMTLDASPEIHADNVRRIRDRYPATTLRGNPEKLYGQPYAAWCKVHDVISALTRSGSRESPLPQAMRDQMRAAVERDVEARGGTLLLADDAVTEVPSEERPKP
ncbi:MAG: hypothetical protein ABW167_16575 [Baekduia sp.]